MIRAKAGHQIVGVVLVGALGGLTQSPPLNASPANLIEARRLLLIPDVDSLLRQQPNAAARRYDGAGHSPFAEHAVRFNEELRKFVELTARSP